MYLEGHVGDDDTIKKQIFPVTRRVVIVIRLSSEM